MCVRVLEKYCMINIIYVFSEKNLYPKGAIFSGLLGNNQGAGGFRLKHFKLSLTGLHYFAPWKRE